MEEKYQIRVRTQNHKLNRMRTITAEQARRRAARTEQPFKEAMQNILWCTSKGEDRALTSRRLNKFAVNKLTKLGYKVRQTDLQAEISWPKK